MASRELSRRVRRWSPPPKHAIADPGCDTPARMAEKHCSKCGTVKPVEEFPIRRASADDRSHWCRACHAVAKREYRQRHGERFNAARRRDPIPERTCRTCGQPFMPARKDQNYCRTWCQEHSYLTRIES